MTRCQVGSDSSVPPCTRTLGYGGGLLRSAVFYLGPWEALTANRRQLPLHVPRDSRFARRSPERQLGLADSLEEASRIKSFRLEEALVLAYGRDIRFVVAVCAMIGFGIWRYMAPEPLLLTPRALSAPDLPLVTNVVKDTFVNKVCNLHPEIRSPCPCGEPLNNTARDLFPKPGFDSLDINKSAKVKALAVFMACIVYRFN